MAWAMAPVNSVLQPGLSVVPRCFNIASVCKMRTEHPVFNSQESALSNSGGLGRSARSDPTLGRC